MQSDCNTPVLASRCLARPRFCHCISRTITAVRLDWRVRMTMTAATRAMFGQRMELLFGGRLQMR
jgi:hypothetical protein